MSLILLRLLILSIVAGWVPYTILKSENRMIVPSFGPLSLTGGIAALAGIIIYLLCIWEFNSSGGGMEPNRMVARGLYRWTRNPMYASMTLILLGESLLFGSWKVMACALILWALIHLMVVLYEERSL